RREEPDGSRVDAARCLFQLRDQLHRAHLGRAGDRATGKERAKNLLEAHFVAQLGFDGRGHLPEGGIAFDFEELFRAHAAELGNAAKIVAQQIDDHHVFAAIFWVGPQPFGSFPIFARIAPAPRRSLHRPCDDAPAAAMLLLDAEEQLRRKGQDSLAFASVEECSIFGGLLCAQPRIQSRSIAARGYTPRRSEVQLIDIAGTNPFVNRVDPLRVLILIQGELGDDFGPAYIGLLAFTEFGQSWRFAANKLSGFRIEAITALVNTEPRQRTDARISAHAALRLEKLAALVAEESSST